MSGTTSGQWQLGADMHPLAYRSFNRLRPADCVQAGPRPHHKIRTRPVSLREHALAAGRGRGSGRTLSWRKGSKAALSSHFVFLRVRLAGRRPQPTEDGTIPLNRLIAQWPEGEAEPVKYWVSNLPADIPAKDLVRLAKARWRIEHDYRELKTALGLDHFEGRSFTGWHRHVTLVTAAHLFLTEQRRTQKPLPGPDPPSGEATRSISGARSRASDSRSTSRAVLIGAGGQATGCTAISSGMERLLILSATQLKLVWPCVGSNDF